MPNMPKARKGFFSLLNSYLYKHKRWHTASGNGNARVLPLSLSESRDRLVGFLIVWHHRESSIKCNLLLLNTSSTEIKNEVRTLFNAFFLLSHSEASNTSLIWLRFLRSVILNLYPLKPTLGDHKKTSQANIITSKSSISQRKYKPLKAQCKF